MLNLNENDLNLLLAGLFAVDQTLSPKLLPEALAKEVLYRAHPGQGWKSLSVWDVEKLTDRLQAELARQQAEGDQP